MKRIALLAITSVLIAGCQSTGTIWTATSNQDQFTDVSTKMVTIGEGLSNQLIVTKSLKYYPFVGVQNGELFVGVRSGGRYRIPTGTVQIRIDSNEAWTITPDETPIYLAPSIPAALPQVAHNSSGVDLASFQAQAMQNVTKIMSPYTATTGDKAKRILKEMLAGKTVKYRTVGINQAASTTGEVVIDASFVEALRQIGIKPENL
jgi:hypothetical protein